MRIPFVLASVALTALLLAGCGDGEAADDDAGADTQQLTVEAQDNEFVPADVEVAPGEVELTLDNTGEARHNFVSDDLDVEAEADGGEQATATFTADPGVYDFVCTFHESLGMVGTLEVTE